MQRAILGLRVVFVGLTAVLLLLALLSFPGEFFFNAPRAASLADWILFVGLEVALISVLVIISALWRLLTLIQRDALFTRGAIRLVDISIAAAALVTAIFGIALILLVIFGDDPGPGVMATLFGLISATVALVGTVVRGVLIQQTELN